MKLSFQHLKHWKMTDQKGAVLVEFALIMPIIIVINIVIYDLASYFRLAERSKHAAQVIQNIVVNDSDHRMTINDLDRMFRFHNLVIGLHDHATDTAIVVMDVMPAFINKRWNLVVCWAWSSDPSVAPSPINGSRLSPILYPVDPWVPTNGLAASSALVIVETHQRFKTFSDVQYLPARNQQFAIGPVRFIPGMPVNMFLNAFPGGPLLNDSTIRDPNAGNGILCQR